MFFERTVAVLQLLDTRQQVFARCLEPMRGEIELGFAVDETLDRGPARDRLDAPDARCDAGFHDDLEQADVAGPRHVGTAAELDRIGADPEHAHLVAVFFAEQGDGAGLFGGLHAHELDAGFDIAAYLLVDEGFDLADFAGLERLVVREIEAQLVGVDERAFLLHVFAEHPPERGMHEMRGRMIEHDRAPPRRIDLRLDGIADGELAALQGADVQEHVALLLRVLDAKHGFVAAGQLAGIADLSARLRVKRGAIEDDERAVAVLELIDTGVVLQDRDDPGRRANLLVAEKLAGRILAQVEPAARGVELARGARAGTLRLHFDVEAMLVDGETFLARDIRGQVGRKTIGIVKLENRLAVDGIALQAADRLLENTHALFEGFGESLLFLVQYPLDVAAMLAQFRIGVSHLFVERFDEPVEKRLAATEMMAVARGAADDAPEDVTPALVGGQHAVDDQERAGTNVVGDDAQRLVFEILAAGQLRGGRDQRLEQIDFVVVVHVLHDRREPLQSHAGIHRRFRQGLHVALGIAVELHENQVPDFDVAIAVFVRGARRAALDLRPVVVEYLAAGSAGTGIAHRPEIVRGADAGKTPGVDADILEPDPGRLVVLGIDGHPELFRRQPDDVGEEIPGVMNRFLFEILAEAEITEHFEKGVMARRVTDIFEVVVLAARAHAALRGRGAGIAALLGAQKHVLELHHAGIGEQQRRIVAGHQRARRHDGMSM